MERFRRKVLDVLSSRIVLVVGFAVATGASLHFGYWGGRSWGAVLHIALPAMVLFMELYMLVVMTVESKEREEQIATFKKLHEDEVTARKSVLDDLNRFRISTSREHYRQELTRTLRAAKESVVFTGVTMTPSHRDRNQQDLILLTKEKERQAEEAGTVFLQRGLIGDRIEAIAGAVELACMTKTELKFRKLVVVTRLRFQVCDRTISVLGVAEGEPTASEVKPTERAFTIDSAMLGDSLAERFDREWNDPASKDVWTVVDELVADLLGSTTHERTLLTQQRVLKILDAEWMMDRPEIIQRLRERSASFNSLPEPRASLHGAVMLGKPPSVNQSDVEPALAAASDARTENALKE